MKFKSAVFSQVSGSQGGTTYSHNQGGMYTRNRSKPTQPNSAQQQAVKGYMGTLSAAWNLLSAAVQAGFATFAANVPVINKIGDTIHLSSRAWYMKMNIPRLQAALTRTDVGPSNYSLAGLTQPTPTIVAAGTTASIAFTNTDHCFGGSLGGLLVYASRPKSSTINFFKGPYRFAGKIAGAATPPASPQNVTLPYTIGAAGSKMFFKFEASDTDGRPSLPLLIGASA